MNTSLRFAPFFRTIVCAAILAAITGCNAVYVHQSVGEKVSALQPERWNGVWLADDNSPVTVLVTNAGEGQLKIAAVETKDETLTLSSETILVRGSGEWFFVNLRSTHDGQERFAWGLLKFGTDTMALWFPDVEKFRTLVRSGKLKGRATESGDVYVDSLSADLQFDLTKGRAEGLLDWQSPVTLRRVKR